jgi:hypothetical protein
MDGLDSCLCTDISFRKLSSSHKPMNADTAQWNNSTPQHKGYSDLERKLSRKVDSSRQISCVASWVASLDPAEFYFVGCTISKVLPYWQRAVTFQSIQLLGYGLDDRGSTVPFPAGAGNFSLHHRVQNGSAVHPSYYPMGTEGSFPGDKAAGA